MSTEVLVGVIGLSGAIVGAAAAFSGVVYQQRHQARLAQRQRLDLLGEKAVDTIMEELEKLRALAWSLESDDELPRPWLDDLSGHLSVIRGAALRLPMRELRISLEAAIVFGFGTEPAYQEFTGLRSTKLLMLGTCADAQRCLGAYLRQEPQPEAPFLGKARPCLESVTTLPFLD